MLTLSLCFVASSTADLDVVNSMKSLHLTIVTTEDPPFIVVRDNDGKVLPDYRDWSGWIPATIHRLSEEAGFTYTLQLNSGGANKTTSHGESDKDLVHGTKTRHAHLPSQVGRTYGEPDVHWAGAYMNWKRLDATHMTASFHTAPLSLLVKAETKTWRDKVFLFAEPFTPNLWLSILSLGMFGSLVMVILEGGQAAHSSFHMRAFRSSRQFAKDYITSIYLCFGAFSGIGMWRPYTTPGKILAGIER
jgi:hypothetical protein